MLEEEYERRRVLPRHLRPQPAPEAPFAYSIRPAERRDIPDIREIYNYYVTNSVVTFDEKKWTLAKWREKFDQIAKAPLPFLVAESPTGQVLGYALVQPWSTKAAYRYTVEDSIYIAPEAAEGGPIGLVQDGDRIRVDIAGRTMDLLVDEAELAARRESWEPVEPKFTTGVLGKYAKLVHSAAEGAYLG